MGLTWYNWPSFTSCRRQAPTGRHANPTLVGGSDDEAAGTNSVSAKSASAEAEEAMESP